MRATRKTVDRTTLITNANRMLASDGLTPEGRAAINHLMSSVLMDSGSYRGFGYLASELVEDTDDYGVRLRDGYDDTRTRWY